MGRMVGIPGRTFSWRLRFAALAGAFIRVICGSAFGFSRSAFEMESRRRSILKAVTYRVTGFLITAGIVYILTGKIETAFAIGLTDAAVKIFVYYLHERLWSRIRYGLSKGPEYRI